MPQQNTKDYQARLQAAHKAYKTAPSPDQKRAIVVDCIMDILNDWKAYKIDTVALRAILQFGFKLPQLTLTTLFTPLLSPAYATHELDTEQILQVFLNTIRVYKLFNSTETLTLEQHFIVQYFKENNTDDIFKYPPLPALLNPLYRVFDALKAAYETESTLENYDLLSLVSTSIVTSVIKHGQASILHQLRHSLQSLDFYDEIIDSLNDEQKTTLHTLENVQSLSLVTKVLQEYTLGEFGRISPESAQLDLACRAARKAYTLPNITVLEDATTTCFVADPLTTYLQALKNANYPLAEYFILTGCHWTSGYLEIDKAGNCKILLIDSLGHDLTDGYYPATKIILEHFTSFKPTKESTLELYFANCQRQHSATGCRVYALDDTTRLHTLTHYLPEPYKNESIFSYLSTHVTQHYHDTTLKNVNFVDLPLALMRATQTSQPARILSQRPLEALWPVNKKGESAEIAFQNSLRLNPRTQKNQMSHIKLKLKSKQKHILNFLADKTLEMVPALQAPFTLKNMIERVTALTLMTPPEWERATPAVRLQQLSTIFKKLNHKAQRLDNDTLQSEIKKHAGLAFLYLESPQASMLFEKFLSQDKYFTPLSKAALFSILLELCEATKNSEQIIDKLLAVYLENNAAEKLLSLSHNTPTEQSLENALQRFVHNTDSDKTAWILKALILYTLQTYHAELCRNLSTHPIVLSKPQKQIYHQLLGAIDPKFVTQFMSAYKHEPFGDIHSVHLYATLAHYAERYPLQATNTTLLRSKKEIENYFASLAHHTPITPEYFIVADHQHWITGMITSNTDTQDTELLLLDATGRNLQSSFSGVVQKTLDAFRRFFKTDAFSTHTAYVAETVRHTDTRASWIFALRDLKNLFTLRALPKACRAKGIFAYLQAHPANSTYNTAGLDLQIVELPPRLAALSVKAPGHQKYKKAERVVHAAKKTPPAGNNFLVYKLIRQAQKILGFIIDKTPETVESYSFAHTLKGCLERREMVCFSQASLGCSEDTAEPALVARDRNLSISV